MTWNIISMATISRITVSTCRHLWGLWAVWRKRMRCRSIGTTTTALCVTKSASVSRNAQSAWNALSKRAVGRRLSNGKDRFLSLFDGDGTHRLMVEYDGRAKPLVYEVDIVDEMDITKTWARYNDELMVGTFTLQLVEDEPVKKVLRHVAAAAGTKASFTVSTYKLLNVYWGDGTHTFNVKGDDVTVEHTYEKGGEFDIVITGVIEDIEKFETNEIVVWEILK